MAGKFGNDRSENLRRSIDATSARSSSERTVYSKTSKTRTAKADGVRTKDVRNALGGVIGRAPNPEKVTGASIHSYLGTRNNSDTGPEPSNKNKMSTHTEYMKKKIKSGPK